jgi:hypothetical protein
LPVDEDTALLDDSCHDLIRELSQWTETILGGRVSEIQRHRMGQTEHVLELLQFIVEPLSKAYATVERYFSTDRNHYFASLRSFILLAHGVKKRMRLIDQREVENMATGAILMWRHVRLMQSRMIISNDIPALPLQLKQWILQDERRFDEWRLGMPSSNNSSTLGHHQMYCRTGTGGKRRMMCVLVGLVYRWLEDRCMEWKAEVAERELLTDFDFAGTPASVSNGTSNSEATKPSKSSKRNKKKKNKGAQSPLNASDNPSNIDEPAKSNQLAAEEGSKVNGHSTKDPEPENKVPDESLEDEKRKHMGSYSSFESFKSEDTAREEDTSTANDNGASELPLASEPDVVPESDENVAAEEQEIVEDEESQILEIDISLVYVEDAKQILPAKDFLVGRLAELLGNSVRKDVVVIDQ